MVGGTGRAPDLAGQHAVVDMECAPTEILTGSF